ncbi:dienelactone hydrolase family protein [bacterium]|nr:dienelactone hydrolase family protein [bacterium]
MSARQWPQASWTTGSLWLNETAGNRHHRLIQPSISALTSRIFRTHRTAITLLDDLDTKKPVADQTNLFSTATNEPVVQRIFIVLIAACFYISNFTSSHAAENTDQIANALKRAGSNRSEIQTALDKAPSAQKPGMKFLVAHMPDGDLKTLSAKYLLTNLELAYQAWDESPWKNDVPESLFFNNVLPYANINEQRDSWRTDFYKQCKPLISGAKTPAEAAVLLNQKLFKQLNVKYSTKRNRADQGPSESIRTGLASCTGLSILLIDACRSVGIPARFVGTPLWTNKSGNHSWVEIWDDGWHFTGACEPTGGELDKGWFAGRATTAQSDHPLHAIYAVSYKKTPSPFPMVWAPTNKTISAVNVTDRYASKQPPLPAGHVEIQLRVVDGSGNRVSVPISLLNNEGNVVVSGKTKDERFDANDHLSVALPENKKFKLQISLGSGMIDRDIVARKQNEPVTIVLGAPPRADQSKTPETTATPDNDCVTILKPVTSPAVAAETPVQALKNFLSQPSGQRENIADQAFSTQSLSKVEAKQASKLLWDDHVATIREERKQEMEAGKIVQGNMTMPFVYRAFGKKPKNGRSLYISMHGGGGAPPQVNDQQWENQKRLYTLPEGIYAVPRAPTNTWNLWHQGHIDGMFARLIENLIVFEDVNPDRVYLMGYSAGGDGVYQLAPRMADRFAAAAMMAGHPNETSPLGLRNTAFTLHMGGKDAAYKRNQIAEQWKQKLADLQKQDPKGYEHLVQIYPDKGHWMDRKDASAIPWMARHERKRYPKRVVWKQDDVKHTRFYWLAADKEDIDGRPLVTVERDGQQITIEQSDLNRLTLRLCDEMLDLDQPVEVTWLGEKLPSKSAQRTIGTLAKTLKERGEREGMFSAEVEIVGPTQN